MDLIISHPDTRAKILLVKLEEGLARFQLAGPLAAAVDLGSLTATRGAILKGSISRWFQLHRSACAQVCLAGLERLGLGEVDGADVLRSWLPPQRGLPPQPDWSLVRATSAEGSPMSLRPYQAEGCSWAWSMSGNGLLGDEMGLGKTVQVGALLEAMRGVRRRALIVTTSSTLYNWQSELSRWAPSWTPVVVPAAAKLKKSSPGSDILILTWDMLSRVLELVLEWSPDTLIADEAHYLAGGYSTQRGRSFFAVSSRCLSTMLMTGTPLVNRPADLWPLLHVLDPVRFSTFGSFGDRFCDPEEVKVSGGRQVVQYRRSANEAELAGLLSGFQLRRLKADVLSDLPARLETTVRVEVSASTRKAWVDLLKQLRASKGDGEVEVAHVGRCWHDAGRDKVKIAAEYISDLLDAGEGPVIALVYHSDVLHDLVAALDSPGRSVRLIDGETPPKVRASLVDLFQSGGLDVIVGSTALKEGVTLTRARHVVQVEYWWTEAAMDQGASRAHRFGQERDVQVSFVHGIGSIDDHIKRIVRGKKALRESIVEAAAMASFVSEIKESLE